MPHRHVHPEVPSFPKINKAEIPSLDTLSDFSIVIPHKDIPSDPHRLLNLRQTVSFYLLCFPKAEIIVVEQVKEEPSYCDSRVTKVNLQLQGLFNKPKLLNLGWAHASHDVLMFCDNDLICEPWSIKACIALIQSSQYDLLSPYVTGFNLPNGYPFTVDSPLQDLRNTLIPLERNWSPLCGGAFVTTKDFYYSIGGFDESFIGWGPEDVEASIKAIYKGRTAAIREGAYFHLWHQRAELTQGQPVPDQDRLIQALQSLSDNDLDERILQQKAVLSTLKDNN